MLKNLILNKKLLFKNIQINYETLYSILIKKGAKRYSIQLKTIKKTFNKAKAVRV